MAAHIYTRESDNKQWLHTCTLVNQYTQMTEYFPYNLINVKDSMLCKSNIVRKHRNKPVCLITSHSYVINKHDVRFTAFIWKP